MRHGLNYGYYSGTKDKYRTFALVAPWTKGRSIVVRLLNNPYYQGFSVIFKMVRLEPSVGGM